VASRVLWLCILSLVPAACGVGLIAQLDAGRTGARVVTWFGPDGERVPRVRAGDPYPFDGCHGDIGLTGLLHGGALWTVCSPRDRLSFSALARIDPAAGEAHMRWPFPVALSNEHTVALAPGPDGALGVVYRYSNVNGPLAVAVAGPDGWTRAPITLDAGASSTPLGVAWVGDSLEVVVKGGEDVRAMVNAEPEVISVGAEVTHAPFLSSGAMCEPEHACSAGVAFRSDGRWWVALEGGPRPVNVARDGTRAPSRWPDDNAVMLDAHVDNSVTGVLRRPVLGRLVLGQDGALQEPPADPPPPFEPTAAWSYYDTDAGYLRHRPMWAAVTPTFVTAHSLDGRPVALSVPESDDNLRVIDLGDPAKPRETIVAKATVYSCGELQAGTFLPRPGGGHFLVSPSGCYLAVGDDLSRADPLDVLEHLRRRGSLGVDWDEPSHALMLAWVLFGLPLALLLAEGLSFVWSRARATTSGPRSRRIGWGAAAYLVSSIWMLARLAPLFL
jgi:hypothetical protein